MSSPAGRQGNPSSGWRKRAGSAVLVTGLLAGGLWFLGGSAAQAQVVSEGTLVLRPGAGAVADSGLTFDDGGGKAVFDVPGPAGGGGLYLGLQTRAVKGSSYVSKVRIWADGKVTVGLSKNVNGAEQRFGDTAAGFRVSGPAKLNVETRVSGSTQVKFAVRAWLTGETRPGWQLSVVDTAADRITRSGALQTWAYLSSAASESVVLPFSGLNQVGAGAAPSPAASTVSAAPSTTTPAPVKAPQTEPPVKPKPTTPAAKATPAGSGRGDMPGAGNTGVPDGTRLKVHKGDLTITEPGAIYDSLDIRGFVDVEAPDVTIKRSIIRGGTTTGSRGVINSTSARARNFLLVDSEIAAAHPTNTLDGINGGNFTLRRVEVNGGVDTVHVHGNNVRVESSWLHGNDFFALGANGDGGPSHNDGVQVLGGDNIQIVGSLIQGARNAAVMVSQSSGPSTDVVIKNNWLNDGGCTVNIIPKNLASIGPIIMTGNRFGGTTRVANCPVARTASTNLVARNNVYASNGKAITINVWN
jgi:hypothetical protein